LDTLQVIDVKDQEGEMVDLEAQLTVKKHLRPGGIVPVQYNMSADGQHLLADSTDQLANTDMNLIVNRDVDGYAYGRLYIDEGKNVSELTKKDYEYYEFKLVNKTLQKLTLNTDYISTGRQTLASIVIADAEDLRETENMQACIIDRSGFKSADIANPVWDSTTKSLTIRNTVGDPINLYQMQAIILRSPSDKYSLCDVSSAGWYVAPESYNTSSLNGEYAEIKLTSKKYTELNMTMQLRVGGDDSRIVNIKIKPDLLLG
jgi:hypothetical protein